MSNTVSINIVRPLFSRNETVYHVTPESPKGVVLDVLYRYYEGVYEYEVRFNPLGEPQWYREHELSSNITF